MNDGYYNDSCDKQGRKPCFPALFHSNGTFIQRKANRLYVIFKLFFLIAVKYMWHKTYYLNPFKVQSWMTWSTVTRWCSNHHHPSLKRFSSRQNEIAPFNAPHGPLLQPLGTTTPFRLYEFDNPQYLYKWNRTVVIFFCDWLGIISSKFLHCFFYSYLLHDARHKQTFCLCVELQCQLHSFCVVKTLSWELYGNTE